MSDSHTTPTGATRLADWGVIRAVGPDARSFLHGQLTQDVQGLALGEARLAGYCSAKGRLLASFVIWAAGPEEVLLACSADLLPATLKRLSMFVLRARCKLSDASAGLALWGLAGDLAAAGFTEPLPAADWQCTSQGAATLIALPAAPWGAASVRRYLLATMAEAAPPRLPALDAEVWRALEVRSGVPRVLQATVEQFVPQMVNLELVGGVNFKKGCYPGQEVVARSQYRGTLKRRGFVLEGDRALAPGQEVFHSADPGQPAGTVALAAAPAGGPALAFVELKLAATEGGQLHAGAADGPPLRLAAQPYPLPTEAA